MSLKITQNTTSTFRPVDSGTHAAILSGIVDLGTQKTEWAGEVKQKPQIRLTFSFPEQTLDDGRAMTISKTYTASLHENSALRAALEGIRGRKFTDDELAGFDIAKAMGAPCLVNILHEDSEFGPRAKLAGVMPLPKAMPKPDTKNVQFLCFDLGEPNDDVFELLPPWQKELIAKSPEYQKWEKSPPPYEADPAVSADAGADFAFDDTIPF